MTVTSISDWTNSEPVLLSLVSRKTELETCGLMILLLTVPSHKIAKAPLETEVNLLSPLLQIQQNKLSKQLKQQQPLNEREQGRLLLLYKMEKSRWNMTI
jgi:hypothetical protein